MRIASNTEVQQIADRPVRTMFRDRSLQCETLQYLRDLEIKEVRRVQGFVTRINSLLDALARGCLKEPVNCGRRIEDDHRASRSSRNRRTVSICAETGLRLCSRSRNSRSVGRSAISLISVVRKRHTCHSSASFQAAVQSVGYITKLNHLGHAISILSCYSHVAQAVLCPMRPELFVGVQVGVSVSTAFSVRSPTGPRH